MDIKDSSTAISSLTQYGDVSDDEFHHEAPGSIDNISDDEIDNHKREEVSVEVTDDSSKASIKVSEVTELSNTPTKTKLLKRATKLVSYGPDDHEEEDKTSSEEEEEVEEEEDFEIKALDTSKGGSCLESEVASSLSRSVLYMPAEDIKLPPEPSSKCSKSLQEKIAALHQKMIREGLNLNDTIQRRKDFRNTSIYEKLIDFCGIDSHGSNFPPEIYNPYLWSKDSFYDELDKVQKKEMEKREKDRKDRTKVEFVVGTKKSSSADSSAPDEKKRKTKWDTVPNVSSSLTSSVTGTKSTVIPAIGNISKKSK